MGTLSRSVILGADARPDLDLRDPVCDDFFQLWQDTAESNANIYEQVGTGGGGGWLSRNPGIIVFRVEWREPRPQPVSGRG